MTSTSRRACPTSFALAVCAGILWAAAGCITPDGYYRDLDGGSGQGGSGTGGAVGGGGAGTGTGGAGTGGAKGGSPGTGGMIIATGGATGTGGAKGGTTGMTGTGGSVVATGGTTGQGGSGATGTGGAGGAGSTLFTDGFEKGISSWYTNGLGTVMSATDGSTVFEINCPMSKVCLAANGDVNWTDVIVTAKVKILSFNGSSSSYYAAVCARVADADDWYCVTLRSDGNVAIRGDIAGSSGSIGSSASASIVTGTWYTVQLEVVGSTITASLNGTPVLPKSGSSAITDSSVTHGGVGLAVDNGVVEFDDVTVTTP